MPFHGRGRGGKRHLQRRFLRKRGAAAGACSPGGAVAQRLRGYKWRSEKSVKAIAPTGAALAFLCFDFCFRIVKGEQPLARCGVGGVQRQGGVFRLPPPYLWTPPTPQRNNCDRRQWRKQGAVVGAAASKTRVPPKARCGCWVPQPVAKGYSPLTILKKKSKHKKASAAPVGAIALTLFSLLHL